MALGIGSLFLTLLAIPYSYGYSVQDLKVAVHHAVRNIESDVAAKVVHERSSPAFATFVSQIVQDEVDDRVAKFEAAVGDYKETIQKITTILKEIIEPLRQSHMDRMSHVPTVADEILQAMPRINELVAAAKASLAEASNLAKGFNWPSVANEIAVRRHDLSDRGILGWMAGIVTGGPAYIINNIASFAAYLSPTSASSITFVQYVAQEILDSVVMAGSTLTQTGAMEILAFLGPFKDILGDVYVQIIFSFQQTFPAIFT